MTRFSRAMEQAVMRRVGHDIVPPAVASEGVGAGDPVGEPDRASARVAARLDRAKAACLPEEVPAEAVTQAKALPHGAHGR